MSIFARIKMRIKSLIDKYSRYVRDRNEKKHLQQLRDKNKNKQCTIICNNCVGGVIYHNLGMRFDSPTINLSIRGEDYLEFCKNFKYYMSCDLVENQIEVTADYPIGTLVPQDDQHIPIKIHFEHYKTFAEAKSKWMERCRRVDYENIYFIWEFYDTKYDFRLASEFDNLPVKHKMILTHNKFPEIKNGCYISCYVEDKPVAKILEYNGRSGKRYLDEFDYVGFINRE